MDSTTTNPASDPRYASQAPYDSGTGAAVKKGLIWMFFYDKDTKVLLIPVLCYKNPGDAPRENATYVVPPQVPSGMVAVFKPGSNHLGSWYLAEDHRGTVVYSKNTQDRMIWQQPGAIGSAYTTKAPTSSYQVWDEAKGEWVSDPNQERAALAKKAYDRYVGQILPDNQTLAISGIQTGPQYAQYVSRVMAIMSGSDTTSTELPPVPQNPTL